MLVYWFQVALIFVLECAKLFLNLFINGRINKLLLTKVSLISSVWNGIINVINFFINKSTFAFLHQTSSKYKHFLQNVQMFFLVEHLHWSLKGLNLSKNYETKVIISIKSMKQLFKVTCRASLIQNKNYFLIWQIVERSYLIRHMLN